MVMRAQSQLLVTDHVWNNILQFPDDMTKKICTALAKQGCVQFLDWVGLPDSVILGLKIEKKNAAGNNVEFPILAYYAIRIWNTTHPRVISSEGLALQEDMKKAFLVCIAAVFFVFWALSSQQMRFLLPALPLLAMAGAVSLGELLGRLRLAWRPWQLLAGAALLIVTVQGPYLAGGFRTLFAFASKCGLRGASGFLKGVSPSAATAWLARKPS